MLISLLRPVLAGTGLFEAVLCTCLAAQFAAYRLAQRPSLNGPYFACRALLCQQLLGLCVALSIAGETAEGKTNPQIMTQRRHTSSDLEAGVMSGLPSPSRLSAGPCGEVSYP